MLLTLTQKASLFLEEINMLTKCKSTMLLVSKSLITPGKAITVAYLLMVKQEVASPIL
jgi:hypothetical protein